MRTARGLLYLITMHSSRGFTILELLIVLAIIGVVMGLLIVPQLMSGTLRAKRQQTKIEQAQLVGAYTQWTWDHSADGCPTNLDELRTYVRRRDMRDPWGTAYEMQCGIGAPQAADGFGVLSYAQDRTRATPDDIASWDERQ